MEINFLISIPEAHSICGAAEYTKKPRAMQIYLQLPRRHRPAAFQSFSLRPSVRLKFIGLDLKTFSTGLPLSK